MPTSKGLQLLQSIYRAAGYNVNGNLVSETVDLGLASRILHETEMQAIGSSSYVMGYGMSYLSGALYVTNSGPVSADGIGVVHSSFANAFHSSLNPSGGGVDVPEILNYGMTTSRNTPWGIWHGQFTKGSVARPANSFIERTVEVVGPKIDAAYAGRAKVISVDIV